jgi:hypothetical protein
MKSSFYRSKSYFGEKFGENSLVQKSLLISVFFLAENRQIPPKNPDQPPVGLDFRGKIQVFSP